LVARNYRKSRRESARRFLAYLAIRTADVVVVPSNSMIDPVLDFCSRRRLGRVSIEVIPHGKPNWESLPMRELHQPVRLLFPSHVGGHKNFGLLGGVVRALYTRRTVDFRLTLTAESQEDCGGRPLIEWFRNGLEKVDFVGAVERRNLRELYETHDIVVFPSIAESFGLPLVEAMTSGMPIVVSDFDWAKEICGPAAIYVDPGGATDWAEAVEDIVARGYRSNEAGVMRAQRFNWAASAEEYASLLLGN
jgi:glycosyltransferase involved in cell wall biosynthesis